MKNGQPPKRIARQLNVPFLLGSLAIMTTLAVIAFGVQRWQVTRTAEYFLTRADELEQESKWMQAADYVNRYLQIFPDAAQERVRLARVFAKNTPTPVQRQRAIDLLYRAIGANIPEEEGALRTQVGELLLQNRRFIEAGAESEKLLRLPSGEIAGKRMKALALVGQYQTGALAGESASKVKVIEALVQAQQANPAEVEIASLLARAYLDTELARRELPEVSQEARLKLADKCMDELIRARPKDAKAYLVRSSYRRRSGLPGIGADETGASQDLEQALQLAPNDLTVLLSAGQTARENGERLVRTGGTVKEATVQFERALAFFQKVIDQKLAPNNPFSTVSTGEILLALGKREAALATWTKGVREFSKQSGAFHVHLADLYLELGRLPDAEKSLDAIQQDIDKLPPNMLPASRLVIQRDQDLRRGLLFFKRGDARSAIPLLQQVILKQEQLGGDSPQSGRAWLLLGASFAAEGEWNQSAEAFDRASVQQPNLAIARISASTSWLAANRPNLAVDRAELAVRLESSSRAWFALAAANFKQQFLLPAPERIWSQFDSSIAETLKRVDDGVLDEPWRVYLLHADYLVAKNGRANPSDDSRLRALEVLRQAEAKYPSSSGLWQLLPLVYQRLGQADEANRSLQYLRDLAKGAEKAPFVEARMLSLRGNFDAAEKLLKSAEGTSDSFALQRELINLKLARRDLPAARKLLELLHRQVPKDVNVLMQLAEIDIESGKLKEVANWEVAMRAAGGGGTVRAQYLKIRRLILQAKSARDPLLDEALDEHGKLIAVRPTWAEAVALKGVIDQRLGRLDSAIAAYEQAIALGEQRISIFEQLVLLLQGTNRWADAEKHLARLKSHVPLSQSLTEFESAVEIRRQQPGDAVEAARRGVTRRPNDASAHLWLGRMLMIQDAHEEARKEFERAVELQPKDVRSWNGLFFFHVSQGNKELGRETLKRLSEKANLPPAQLSFVLAQGYEFLGDQEQARVHYIKADEQSQGNTAILLRMSGFYLRSDPDKAEECLERVVKTDPQSGIARRTLAAILATRGKTEDWERVNKLLSSDVADATNQIQDNRMRALLLALRGGPAALVEAAAILEDLVAQRENASSTDRLLLAQLYEKLARVNLDDNKPLKDDAQSRDRHLARCREQYVTLCATATPNPNHLIAFIEYLQRQKQPMEAGVWLAKLDKLVETTSQPSAQLIADLVRLHIALDDGKNADKWQVMLEKSESDSLRTVSLRAHLMKREGKQSELEAFVEDAISRLLAKAEEEKQRIPVLRGAGGLYASLGMAPQAESWYRKLYEQAPGDFQPLVGLLAKNGRTAEAIKVCQTAAEANKSPRPAVLAASILTTGKAGAPEALEAERIISTALSRFPKDLPLLLNVATLRVVQNRTDDAVSLLRTVVELDPRHVVALNNLATLLSERPGDRKEALKLIDQAIAITGREPALFDTKGTILVFDGQPERAIEFLKAAVEGSTADPRYRFHLALAYKDVNQVGQAKDELEQALQQDLDKQILTQVEQGKLTELKAILRP
jgi:tetratricopeptide (TPR) repeat protein